MEVNDYVLKNKDKSFKELKFNEVDALIFAMISYVDFTGYVKEKITMYDAYKLMEEKLKIKEKDRIMRRNRELFAKIATTPRYKDIYLENYKRVTNKTTQFGAITIRIPHLLTYISFEGTENDLAGWEEDCRLSYEYPINAHKLATDYINGNVKFTDILVYIGGHSKGGNLAVAALMNANFKARIRCKRAFNFDGPGFLQEQVNSKEYQRVVKKIRNYYPEESTIGMLLNHEGEEVIFKSKGYGINQHASHNWRVYNNKFVRGRLSKYSKEIHNRTIKITEDFTLSERKKAVNYLFSLLYNSGYTKRSDVNLFNISGLRKLVKETKHLDNDQKKLLTTYLKTLIINKK